jgi:hypothetical protein
MNDLIVVPQTNQWQKLKALVPDSVSSPITKRVYNLGLDEFFAWYGKPGDGRDATQEFCGFNGLCCGNQGLAELTENDTRPAVQADIGPCPAGAPESAGSQEMSARQDSRPRLVEVA